MRPRSQYAPGSRSFRLYRHPMSGVGCTVGLAPNLYVGAIGATAADALSQAGHLAAQLQGLAKEHPEVAAAMALIPGGAAAMSAIAVAAKLYDSGLSVKDVEREVGPIASKVVKGILSLF